MQDNKIDMTISIVIYYPDTNLLHKAVKSLETSLAIAYKDGILSNACLIIINNSLNDYDTSMLESTIDNSYITKLSVITPSKNIGYGRGHNLAFKSTQSKYYLVLNPDVIIDSKAITEAIKYMDEDMDVGMITPKSFSQTGMKQYLCKKYPTIIDLLLRGFAPKCIKILFKKRLENYELQGITENNIYTDVIIASGCFMFLRKKALDEIHGFLPEYFMYFEDFDLSLKLRNHNWKIAYVPDVSIVHYGGNASKKGIKHIAMFAISAIRFFNLHGWKVI